MSRIAILTAACGPLMLAAIAKAQEAQNEQPEPAPAEQKPDSQSRQQRRAAYRQSKKRSKP